ILFSAGLLYVMKYNKWAFELGLTRAHRNPDMNELYIKRMPVGFDTYDYIGNPNLKPELNHQIDLAVKTNISEKIKIGLNLFASQLSSYIGASYLSTSILMPASQGALGVKQFNNFDKAYFMGGELSLNFTHKKLFVHCSGGYTYARVENVEKLIVKDKQVVDSEILVTDPVAEMPPFRVLTNVQYEFSKIKLNPSVQFQYIYKQDIISVSYNELASPEYFLVDLALEWKYRFIALRTGVENVLNENYYDHLNRRVLGGNLDDKIYEPGRNYFVTVRLSF
ncbi:MAG: TonB-dependent receptor, partial [Bacteroidales bacterium]|nr:TonB-dependent receptor [Bacteroidales bacterium]